MAEKTSAYKALWDELRDFLRLNIDYGLLTAAERLTLLTTTITTMAVAGVLATIILLFLTLAVAWWIAPYTGIAWAYFIIFGFYLLLLIAFVIWRKQLVVNPISRFISKLMLKP